MTRPAAVRRTSPRAPVGRQKGDSIMSKAALSLAIIALALPLFAAAPAQAQNARTWVSGTGDNNSATCSRTAPCKSFATALAHTTAGGEINCLDPGSFGEVGINKSITISCEAGTAGIVAPGGTAGIVIDAAATDVVTLRGLDIDGQGTGGSGIVITSARSVHVEKCTIRNFRFSDFSAGIIIQFTSATIFLFAADTVISDNGLGVGLFSSGGYKVASLKNVTITGSTHVGLNVASSNVYVNVTKSIISGTGGSAVLTDAAGATANVDRSTIANNGFGVAADASGSTIRISGNNIYNNSTGFLIAGGAFIQSDGTNNTGGSNGGVTVPNAALTKN